MDHFPRNFRERLFNFNGEKVLVEAGDWLFKTEELPNLMQCHGGARVYSSSHYAGTLLENEEDKCYHFKEDLHDFLRQLLLAMDTTNYQKLVDTTRKLETNQDKVQRRNIYQNK